MEEQQPNSSYRGWLMFTAMEQTAAVKDLSPA